MTDFILITALDENPHCAHAGVLEITATEIRYRMLDDDEKPVNPDAVNLAVRSDTGIPTTLKIREDIETALGV